MANSSLSGNIFAACDQQLHVFLDTIVLVLVSAAEVHDNLINSNVIFVTLAISGMTAACLSMFDFLLLCNSGERLTCCCLIVAK